MTNYSAAIRPYCGNNDVINVTIDVGLRQVMDLDEPSQILKLNIWIRLKWYDCYLEWDPEEYNGIKSIGVPFKMIWTPDLTLYDGMSDEFHFNGLEDFRPIIKYDGSVWYNFPSITETRCIVDVSYFPFDVQTCKLVFGSWAHHGNEIDFKYRYTTGDLSKTEKEVDFYVTQFPAERHVVYYNCCIEPYIDVTFYLKLERKPLFYVVHLLLPTLIVTIMAGLGFLLPAESGEKVSLETTVLLSLTVFQLVIADNLPSAAAIPIIVVFYDLCLFLSAFACITAVLVLNVYYRDSNKIMPKYLKLVFFKVIGRLVCIHLNSKVTEDKNKMSKPIKKTKTKVAPELMIENIGSTTELYRHSESDDHYNNNDRDSVISYIRTPEPGEHKCVSNTQQDYTIETNDWKNLAMILDRLSALIFVSIFVIGHLTIACQYYHSR